jgi:thiamine-phosphate pyrophosphorylase
VFATQTKDTPVVPVGLDMVRVVTAISRLPVTTMGGIKHANAADVIRAGAERVAVVTAVTQAADIAQAARELIAVVETARAAEHR